MMNRRIFATAVLAMMTAWVVATPAAASGPVQRTLTGCVLGGILYTIHEGPPAAGRSRPVVYRITVQEMDLGPYEGENIRLHGHLLPGDRFIPDASSLRVLGPCDRASRKAIRDRGF